MADPAGLDFVITVDDSNLQSELDNLEVTISNAPTWTTTEVRNQLLEKEIGRTWANNWERVFDRNKANWADMNTDSWNRHKANSDEIGGPNDGLIYTGKSKEKLQRKSRDLGWKIFSTGKGVRIVSPPENQIPNNIEDDMGPIFYWGGYMHPQAQPRRFLQIDDKTIKNLTDIIEDASVAAIRNH